MANMMRKPIRPAPEDIERAAQAALMLDIRLTDARLWLRERSKMNTRLVSLVDMTRDIRNELDRIQNELGAPA